MEIDLTVFDNWQKNIWAKNPISLILYQQAIFLI